MFCCEVLLFLSMSIRNTKLCAIKTQKNSKIAGKVLVAILEKLDGGVTISKEIRYQF